MHRFFLPPGCIAQDKVFVTGKIVHRILHVLRLKKGERIIALDNTGWEYEVELAKINREGIEGVVVDKAPSAGEPRTRITLYQALLKGSSFELVLQKCTGIGVAGFTPIICERCVAGEPAVTRLSRWEDIILEAAQQSRRGKLPILHDIMSFREACDSVEGLSILPWEGEGNIGIKEALRSMPRSDDTYRINIFIGPEGGFSTPEVEYTRNHNIMPVSLGSRILRAETAGLVTAAIVLYELDEFNRKS